MPEAAIEEDRDLQSREDDIGPDDPAISTNGGVLPEAKATPMQLAT
jgi:hypothetical protein